MRFNNCVDAVNVKPHPPTHPLLSVRKVGEMASLSEDTNEFSLESVVRGHHVYKCLWTPHIGEQLTLQHEENDPSDSRAVVVTKNDAVIGHFPKKMPYQKRLMATVELRLTDLSTLVVHVVGTYSLYRLRHLLIAFPIIAN